MAVTLLGSVGMNIKTGKLGNNLPDDTLKVQKLFKAAAITTQRR